MDPALTYKNWVVLEGRWCWLSVGAWRVHSWRGVAVLRRAGLSKYMEGVFRARPSNMQTKLNQSQEPAGCVSYDAGRADLIWQ